MARDRRDIAEEERAADAAVPSASLGPAVSAPVVRPVNKPLAGNQEAPHPDLIRFVRLLARQSALADIAAQRATHRTEE